jgi:hypothetical protein
MIVVLKNTFLAGLLVLIGASFAQAQQLIDRSEETYLLHWGVTFSTGLSSQMESAVRQHPNAVPEQSRLENVRYGPRPDITLGIFTEHEIKGKPWAFRSSLVYNLRGIPRLGLNNGSGDDVTAGSIFLNGLALDGLMFFKPNPSMMIGAGFDIAQYFLTKTIKESDNADYVEGLQSYRGVKVVFAYHLNNRTDLNLYGSFGNSLIDKMQVDNVGGGISLTHKIAGRKVKMVKEKYNIDYNTPDL